MTPNQQTAAALLFVAVLILGGWAWSQDSSPSDVSPAPSEPAEAPALSSSGALELSDANDAPATSSVSPPRQGVITNLTIFMLAVYLGIEVISKVPPTLHTPLMSGSNAISGIALVGAVIVASAVVEDLSPTAGTFARLLGFIAVTLAMINAVGGFMVTHRMLSMFTRKK